MSYARAYARVSKRLQEEADAKTKGWTLTKDGKPFGPLYRDFPAANVALCAELDTYFDQYPEACDHAFDIARVYHNEGTNP